MKWVLAAEPYAMRLCDWILTLNRTALLSGSFLFFILPRDGVFYKMLETSNDFKYFMVIITVVEIVRYIRSPISTEGVSADIPHNKHDT